MLVRRELQCHAPAQPNRSIRTRWGTTMPLSGPAQPAFETACELLERILAAANGLSAEQLDTAPWADSSTMFVLATHAISATEWNFVEVLAGQEVDRSRQAEFDSRAASLDDPQGLLDRTLGWREGGDRGGPRRTLGRRLGRPALPHVHGSQPQRTRTCGTRSRPYRGTRRPRRDDTPVAGCAMRRSFAIASRRTVSVNAERNRTRPNRPNARGPEES